MRRFSAFALTAAVALAVAGCSGKTDTPGGGSPRPSGTTTLAKVKLPDDPDALADLASKQIRRMTSVRMTAKASLGDVDTGTITASLGRSGSSPAASLRFEEAPKGTLEIVRGIMIGNTFYFRDLNNDAAPGKPWVRLSTTDLKDPRLAEVSRVFRTAVSELAGAIKQATGASDLNNIRPGKLTAKPEADTVDGAAVRRYEGRTELAKLSGGGSGQDEQILAELQKHGAKSFPWKLWVDHSGLPRKFSVSLKLGERGTFRAESRYSNWGAPVEVKAPPDNQVTGLADVGAQ